MWELLWGQRCGITNLVQLLKKRLDHAVFLYNKGGFDKIIVSGGLDSNGSTITEAEGMSVYLVSQGIPEKSIYEEKKAKSSYENLLFSQKIMEDHNFETSVIITNTYHGARSLNIAKFLNYDDPEVSTISSTFSTYTITYTFREILSFGKWELNKFSIKTNLFVKKLFLQN